MADMEDDEVKEDGSGGRHRYRICELTEASGKGRPKRIELIAWHDLTDADVALLRALNEPRLKPRQVAELDGRTVARGSDIAAGEAEASEPAPHPANLRSDNPMECADFAVRMAWDAYHRSASASAELCAHVDQVNEKVLQQSKVMLELVGLIQKLAQQPASAPPPPPQPPIRPMSAEDIAKLVQVGVAAFKELKKSGNG